MKRSHGYKADAEVEACISNNMHEYRHKGLPVPSEPEVRVIVQAEVNRLHRLYEQEFGSELKLAPKKLLSPWLDAQPPSDEMYAAFRDLEKLYDIRQIVSVLMELGSVGHIGLMLMSIKPTLVVKIRYMTSK